MRRRAAWAVLALAALSACTRAPKLPDYGAVPAFTLTAQSGQPFVSATALRGHIWIADFIYTHCTGPCPMMTTRMRRIQQSLESRPQVRLVSFTVDPERDTPAVLAAYAERFHADPARWYFLTGERTALQSLNRQAFKLGDVDATLEHSTRFVLVDGRSRIRGYYHSGDPDSMAKLLDDVAALEKEPSL